MPTCPLFLLSTIMTRFAKALFIVSLVILGFSHALAKSKTDICIMTYNIRLSADDGVNKWTNRSADNIKMLEYYSPDLIGMQEVRPDQLADLDANLPNYGHVGAGRDDGKNEGEHCPIFYKKNRFVLIESGNFALSENPDVYGVKGWDASYPRIATWAILKDRKRLLTSTPTSTTTACKRVARASNSCLKGLSRLHQNCHCSSLAISTAPTLPLHSTS